MTNRENCEKALNMTMEAEYQLKQALEALSGARGLGIWDIFGGGLLSTFLKHRRMDSAEENIRCAGRLLEDVRTLVPGVFCGRLGEENHDFARLADYMFDGLLSDLYVQGRIVDRQKAVEELLRDVRRLEDELRSYI